MKKIITDFTGGEVSDRFMARVDSSLYPRTSRILENMIVHASGGTDFRPGTYYCGAAKTNIGAVRLIPFMASNGQAYILELSDYLIRVWKDGTLVSSPEEGDLEIVAPWAETDLFELKYVQAEDAMYFAHPDYPLQKLKYFSEFAWSFISSNFLSHLAIAHEVSPYVSVYDVTGYDTLEKKTNPGTLPTGICYHAAWSGDGIYLAIAQGTSPYIHIYKRDGDSFEKLDNPATLPTGTGKGCAFSADGIYLAVAHVTSPYITVYKRDGDTFTKLDNPVPLPAGDAAGCAFSTDGVYLAVCHAGSPYITIYKRAGDIFEKLPDPDSVFSNTRRCAFSVDGNYLAVVRETSSPFVFIYKRSGDTFTKLEDPAVMPTGISADCAWSADGIYLAVAHTTSPYVTIYKRSGNIFTKLDNPATLPTGNGFGCAFSHENKYLAVAHAASPYITIYKRDGDSFEKLDNPATLPTGNSYGCAFSPEGWIQTWGVDYPTALTFHEQRLVVGRGRRIWASRVGYPQDFSQDPSDASYGYEYVPDGIEQIRWMLTKHHNIVISAQNGEWLMTGGGAPITASNVYIECVSAHGSANIAALLANESVLFVQKGGQRLREFMYSEERGGYVSPDLTLLADHIGVRGFKELEWQRSPRSMLWAPMNDGRLVGLTLDRNHEICAWHEHPIDGTGGGHIVESVAVTPGTDEDIVYLLTKRYINGSYKKYIEYLTPINRPTDEEDYFFVDCGKTFDYTDTATVIEGATQAEPVVISAVHPFEDDDKVKITGVVGMTELNGNVYTVKNKTDVSFQLYNEAGDTPIDGTEYGEYVSGGMVTKVIKTLSGLGHLEGKSVAVYADGNKLANETVSSGSITIDEYASRIHVGLPYVGKLYTQRLGNFSMVSIPEATLLLYKTRGGKIGPDADHLKAIRYDSDAVMTGPQEVSICGSFSREGSVMIVQDEPYPMTILGLIANMDVEK